MKVFEIEKYLNKILLPENFNDYCHNGVQIEGAKDIQKVAVGVSFNEQLINQAIDWNADLILVHHGIFGKNFFSLKGYLKNRVEKVIKNNISLIGYHLPLDANSLYGNNISILNKLSLVNPVQENVGYIGEYKSPIKYEKFLSNLRSIIPNQNFICYKNTSYVKKVCIISGGSSGYLESLVGKADTFIAGDVKEQTRDISHETNINFINAGHYSTETFGVINLGNLLRKEFQLNVKFFDIFNNI